MSDVNVREGVPQGYVFLPCDSWAIMYAVIETLTERGIYPARPRSSAGVIVEATNEAVARQIVKEAHVSTEKGKGMPRDEFLNTTLHMLHVAACSAQSTAQMIYGASAAVPFTRIAQILNAMENRQYDAAADQLRRFAEGT